ncbi:uncharacterized protein si:dkeyp-114g9.1 [Brienomyrus brachyistius]|uniref:uncharacterized protein si:dkeyp-114g9.1 n=1 Tax=Brienomyrus brachyistius TaxID=42636 RepID=UPI0020B2BD39|nr:uncharacterized protein si:dkeyp-114g9.1 [Brienomyrus brachyistius]
MALLNGRWERELQEQIALLSPGSAESSEQPEHLGTGLTRKGLLHFSDEVLILILRQLDPVSLLRVGSTCRTMFRICSCSSLWTPHFQASFGVPFAAATCSVSAKDGFRLIFMWRTLYKSLHFNRSLQEKLFAEIPLPPDKYWIQWLVLEETVPLPPVRLAFGEIEALWGIQKDLLERKEQETADEGTLTFEWKELHRRALQQHGSLAVVFQHVLNQHRSGDHRELEALFYQYRRHRFHWFFSYWLFRQPAPLDRQLRTIYLQWRPHSRRKVSLWGSALCDMRYLASLHQVTADYWRGRLARGDEAVGIQTVENYFSMCKSLVAWILGRDWGGLKRKKVYEDTLRGVYRLLRREMLDSLVERDRFWQVAKVQMCRVCTLAETAVNYVNWKMIETLPYYKLYLVSGNAIYLQHVQSFLSRKRLVHDWIHLEENSWLRCLLSDELYRLLEYDTKITQDGLHGDSVSAQLNRVLWLYLHSGQQLYMEALKAMSLQCAHASLGYYAALAAGGLLALPGW